MNNLVTKIKSKIHIPTYRKALGVLEGEYNSASFGRSMEFEDLREYQPGDDVKDIDWKATARHTDPLVRRYIAGRKHSVVFVVDSGKNMMATSPSGERKLDIALMCAGIIGYLAVRHTDSVSAVYGDSKEALMTKSRSAESHLERVLQAIKGFTESSRHESSVINQLLTVERTVRSRSIVVVITDGFETTDENVALLRRLRHKHEMFWLSVADIEPSKALSLTDVPYDINDGYRVDSFIVGDNRIMQEYAESERQRIELIAANLSMLAIPAVTLDSSDEAVLKLITLLKRRRKPRGI